MLCPLCDEEKDFTMDGMELHLREVHKYNDEALVRFGETYQRMVQEQARSEGKLPRR